MGNSNQDKGQFYKGEKSTIVVPSFVREKPKTRLLSEYSKATITDTYKNHRNTAAFIEDMIRNLPAPVCTKLIIQFAKRYNSTTAKNPSRSAHIYLRETATKIQGMLKVCNFNDMGALYREDKLKLEAAFAQMSCRQAIIQPKGDIDYKAKLKVAFDGCARFTARYAIYIELNPAKATEQQYESALVRFDDDEWWYRKLNNLRLQTLEYIEIAAGMVGKNRQEYASNYCVAEYRKQRKNNEAYLKMMDVVNLDTLDTIPLKEIADKTTANPELRRIELMVRARGLEDYADELGYESFFITWTAPSKYHRSSKKWNGAKPNETQAYLCGQWQKCRAQIHRNGVEWFGVRVAEPHASATPHWHMVIFCKPEHADSVQASFRKYALEHDSDEKGARENRLDIRVIDRSQGSATGYLFKYIAKNINANGIEDLKDDSGTGTLGQAAERIVSWACRWKIRQFQFFGTAPVSVYRELRRIKTPSKDESLEAVRLAADGGNWATFVKAIASNPLKLSYQDDETNKYGETVSKIDGVVSSAQITLTRLVKFAIKKRAKGVCSSLLSGDSRAPWSPVNNCTVADIKQDKTRDTEQIKTQLPDFIVKALFMGATVRGDDYRYEMKQGNIQEIAC